MSKNKLMTNMEKKIFRIISEDPLISQNEIAYRANISRSAVSVHISSLFKKGYIAGRGYVISDNESIVAIGAAMIDLYGKSYNPLLEGESNPGEVTIHPGGVSRNISENLSRLGIKIHLITSICDDPFGAMIKKSCEDLNIDISHSYFLENEISTTYLAILDDDGEMNIAMSDTSALDKMPVDHLIKKEAIINRGEAIVIDASLPKALMEYLVEAHPDKKIIIDPVSIGKAHKLIDMVGKFHTIKCNKNEAEFLSNMTINDEDSLKEVSRYFLDKGTSQIFITLGKKGVYYANRQEEGMLPSMAKKLVNVTGAGDAFTAGIAYCTLSNMKIKDMAMFAQTMSSFALESMYAVNPEISLQAVNKRLKEYKKGELNDQ